MRRDDGTPCAACGAVWTRRARYCGVCGAALAADPPHRPTVGGGRSRRRLLAGGALVVVTGMAVTAAWLPGPPASAPAPDAEVALPRPGELPGPPPVGAEADRAGDPPAAAPVCEPVGCEVWRRSLDHPISGLSLGPDRLFYLQASTVVALDRATGVIRWRRPLDEAVRDEDPTAQRAGWSSALLAGDDARVVVATSRGVQLTTAGGRPGWAVSLPVDGLVVELRLAGDVVLVLHEVLEDRDRLGEDVVTEEERAGPRLRAVALSATDGTVRWTRELRGEAFTQTDDGGPGDLLVTRVEDDLVAVELATGHERFRLPATHRDTWPQLLGGFLVLADGPEEPMQVLATRDGSLLAEVPGWPQLTAVVEGRLVAIVGQADPRTAQPSYEAVAVTPDGGVAWTLPLPVTGACCACCPSLLDLGAGRVRIVADPRADAQVVAAATGEVLWRDPLPLDPVEAGGADQWQIGDGLLVSAPHGGDGGFTLFDHSGDHVHVRSGFWPLPERSHVDRSDGLALLASDAELVAVRFP
jgi:hypothetical protein